MSGYPQGGGNPQYPPPQNHIYPQIFNPANAPPPMQPTPVPGYQVPGQAQYPYPVGFGHQYGGQPQQPANLSYPTAMSYPGLAPSPSAPLSAAPAATPTLPGYPTMSPPHQYSTVEWLPTTPSNASLLSDRAVVAGYEAHDGSPLWVIRARFEGDLIPGKMPIKHKAAYVPWGGKENLVHNVEVCCAPPNKVRWLQSSNGEVPPNAVVAGNTSSGEPLYVGRAKHEGSITPGKVHPSHKNMYISFAGKEVPHKYYEVLCTI